MLLGISTAYGFIGKPTEMGLAIIAGALGLAFSNIDRISRFKGAGFEAEMRMVHTIIDNQTEPSPEQKADAKNSQAITALENRVLKRLQKPDYTWRYAKTIAHEIKRANQKKISPTILLLVGKKISLSFTKNMVPV